MHESLPIVVATECEEPHSGPTGAELRALVERIGAEDDRFLVVDRIPSVDQVYVQAWREGDGRYEVEYRDGGPNQHFRTFIADADAVMALFVAWARAADGWRGDHSWEKLEMDVRADVRAETEDGTRNLIRSGFWTYDDVLEAVTDEGEVTDVQAEVLVGRLWAERLAEQADWPETTEADRVLAVFDALEADGITARPNFSCCGNCGVAEIGDEAASDARGYVFFHQQDTESAAAGGGLYMSYGTFAEESEDFEKDTVAIGREVAAALTAGGLSVKWDGSVRKRIQVTPLDWRLRLPED